MIFGKQVNGWLWGWLGAAIVYSAAIGSLCAQTATNSWVTGNGNWGTVGNWWYNSTSGTTRSATVLPGDNNSYIRSNVRFDSSSSNPITITLSSDMSSVSTRSTSTGVNSFTVAQGSWNYYLTNGAIIDGYGGSVPTSMTFGEGSNTVHVSFDTNNATSKILLSSLTLAGSGNSIGTTNATINFNSVPVVTTGFNTLTVSGSNNAFRVSNGSTFNNLNPVAVTMTAGSSNNRIEVDGVGATLNAGNYNIQGTVGAVNQFAVKNGGTITTSNSFTVGSGGQLFVDGSGSKVTLGKDSPVTVLSVETNGEAIIQNQATVSLSGYTTITGHMTVSNATISQKLAVGNNNYQTLQVGGRLDLQNGAHMDVASTGSNLAGMTVSASGVVSLAGQSEMNVQGLAMGSGAQVQVAGNSKLTTQNWQATNNEGLSVESGSTFRFEKLEFTSKDQEYTLANNGKVTWGAGNSNTNYTGNKLHVSSGTTLELTGGTYQAGGSGQILVENGGTVMGSGVVSFSLAGGMAIIGGDGNTSAEKIHGNIGVTGHSTMEFDIYTYGDYFDGNNWVFSGGYDQLDGRLAFETSSGNLLTITVNVADGVIGDYGWQIGDRFQLVDDWSISIGSNQVNFDFGVSNQELAALNLRWDTSQFAVHGYVEIAAIPEPSVCMLMGVGMVFGCYFLRRRTRSRTV